MHLASLVAAPSLIFGAAAVLDSSLTERQTIAITQPSITDPTFINTTLTYINGFRKPRNASALAWEPKLAQYAFEQAQKCERKYSGGPYTETFHQTSSVTNFTAATLRAVDLWMLQEADYIKAQGDPRKGHFWESTALVWKSSKRVGCAWSTAQCLKTPVLTARGWYLWCELDPRGNIIEWLPQNVAAIRKY